jgi:hypothetical protein
MWYIGVNSFLGKGNKLKCLKLKCLGKYFLTDDGLHKGDFVTYKHLV